MAHPLNYCSVQPYDAGILRIGILPEPRDPGCLAVLLTNLATGRTQISELVGDDLDEVNIDHPSDLSPDTVYEIKVIAITDMIGINPVEFFPYLYESGSYLSAYDTVQGVNVRFIKIWDGNDVHSHEEQYITLA